MGVTGKSLNTWHIVDAFGIVAGNSPGDGLEIGIGQSGDFANSDVVYFKDVRTVTHS